MRLEDARHVEFGVFETGRGELCRLGVARIGPAGRGNEMRLDRDQIVDQFRRRYVVVEADAHRVGALGTRPHADRSARAGERRDDALANVGIGMHDGPNNDHVVGRLRMSRDEVRRARVIAVGRNTIWVVPENDPVPILAALRKNDRRTIPAPGDLVRTRQLEPGRLVVDAIEPRSFALVRSTLGGRRKTMAANIDTVAIVAALADPPPGLPLIDRLVAFSVQHGVAAALFLTKPDLAEPAEAERLIAIYEPLGVATLVVGPKAGTGIDELRAFLRARRALLVGHSGVGKSSIFRALGGTAAVGDLSRFGRGRQTTTSARLFQSGEGFLIDSPGIGEFALDPLPPGALARLFVEMREPAARCRFADCRHLSEPDCAVLAAVTAGSIAACRYASYRELALAGGAAGSAAQ